MPDSLCEELLKIESPSSSDIDDLYWSYIANCVLNAFFSYTAIMLNILTIHVIRKTSSLPKTLKTLLLSLAVSDLGVGLLVQPFYSVLLSNWSQQNNPNCVTKAAFTIIILALSFPSFFNVMAITVDRFLAIHLHLRYQDLVTHKRVVRVVILMWMSPPFLFLTAMWITEKISFTILGCGLMLSLTITALLNYKIYVAVRRHKNQIQAQQLQEQTTQNRELANFASVRKSALSAFYVFVVFLFCFLPRTCNLLSVVIYGPTTTNKTFSLYSQTLIFINSSLNPVIYCWKMRHIRHAIIDILRNAFPWRN